MLHDVGLAVGALVVRSVHDRCCFDDGSDDGVADDVGEADLPAARAGQETVDRLAIDLEELGRDLTKTRGGGNGEAGLHVGHDAGGRAAQGDAGLLGRNRRNRRLSGRRSGRCSDRTRSRNGTWGRGGAIAVEELLPTLSHRIRVIAVLLEHFVDEPRVGARDLGGGVVSHEKSAYRRPRGHRRLGYEDGR